jgi:hypothetical protein
MMGGLVKERALANDEIARGESVIEGEGRVRDLAGNLEDEHAQDALTWIESLGELWRWP